MLAIPIVPEIRPNRLDGTPKDKAYHTKFARYCITSGMGHPFHQLFLSANTIFWNFYKGNQWILKEDLASFLMDESGGARNRIQFTENLIRPMVEQWIGNAIRMNFNAKAVNVSPYAKARKEQKLAEMLLMTKVGNILGGGVKQAIQSEYGTGEDEEETKELFENYYVDEFTQGINSLLRWSKDRNRFDNSIIDLTKFMGITGMAVNKGYYMNGEQEWDIIDPSFFYWDRGARRPDLKDSGFMGDFYYKGSPDLFEKHQDLDNQERKAIENFTQQTMGTYAPIYGWMGSTTDRIFVCENYWKDCEKQEFGYVIDQYGEECLKQINVKDDDTGKLVVGSYTDKDLIKPTTDAYQKFLGKGNIKRTMYVDILRYCIFTPREICGVSTRKDVDGDIVYEWGKAPYQETNALDPSSVEYPYKCSTWNYHNGEVLSPIQDAISPQRMLNRSLSATESIINNSRLSGTVIDKNAVDAQGGEDELNRNMNLGKPIYVDTSKMGVQNVIGTYNGSMGSNMVPFMDYAQGIRMVTQNTVGVNEAMQGTGGKSGDLVGVKTLQIQRGSLIQEKFYARIKDIMIQTYQGVASQGKRIYADHPYRLSQIVGEEGARDIIITKDMNLEDFRVFIHTSQPDEDQKSEAMAASLQLFQLGLLGDKQVADVWNRGDLTDVARLLREFANEKTMAMAMQQKAQAQAVQVEEQKGQEMQKKQEQLIAIGLEEEAKNRQNNLDKISLKEQYKSSHIQEQNKGKMADTIIGGEYQRKIIKETPKPVQKNKP
jgi:phosphorylcholine metabolism protein LicD